MKRTDRSAVGFAPNVRTELVGAAIIASLTLTMSACGVPTGNDVQRIDPSQVPSQLIAPATPRNAPSAPHNP